MAILCFVLAIICIVVYVQLDKKYDVEWINAFTIIFIALAVLFCFLGIPGTVDSRYTDQKIQMYQEENEKIEEDVSVIITQYMEHENETFDMSKIESSTVLIQMYPELKSNELVSKQIDIYNENNKKIKKLKLEKIKNQKAKFYLYFGG